MKTVLSKLQLPVPTFNAIAKRAQQNEALHTRIEEQIAAVKAQAIQRAKQAQAAS